MHISGLRTAGVLVFNGRELQRWATIPAGAHNARPFRDGVLFNDTPSDVVRFVSRERRAGDSRCRAFRPRQLTHVAARKIRGSRARLSRGACA